MAGVYLGTIQVCDTSMTDAFIHLHNSGTMNVVTNALKNMGGYGAIFTQNGVSGRLQLN